MLIIILKIEPPTVNVK